MTDAPQTTGVFQPSNWHFPGVAVKGDDAFMIAAWLDDYANIIERHVINGKGIKPDSATIRKIAALFRSCEVRQ